MSHELGPTGNFPDGKLNEDDKGELTMLLSSEGGNVRIDFGRPTAWIAMPKEQALKFAFLILEHCGATMTAVQTTAIAQPPAEPGEPPPGEPV